MSELTELLQKMRAYLIDPEKRGDLLDLCASFNWNTDGSIEWAIAQRIVGAIEHLDLLIHEQNPGFEYTEQDLRHRVLDLLLTHYNYSQVATTGSNATTVSERILV